MVAGGLVWAMASAGANAQQPDPRAMSGISRVDPQTAPATVVVRVLRGSFQDPGVGLAVKLTLQDPSGGEPTERTVVSVDQGRATFANLEAFAGWTAIASVDFGNEVVRSQPLRIDPSVGVRLLLVAGASPAPQAAANAAANAGANAGDPSEVPRPGVAFANPGQAVRTVMVGALDLAGGRPYVGVEVTLEVSLPDGQTQQRKGTSDGRGAVRFTDLSEVPEGASLVAKATLEGVQMASEPFTLDGHEHGLAVVLATTSSASAAASPSGQRNPLPPARAVPTLPAGTVKVMVLGADDQPVADAKVAVVKYEITGTQQRFDGVSASDGTARIADISVAEDSSYQVEVIHQGAPFRSGMFGLSDRMGVLAAVRVFPVTSDVSKIRSAVQFGIEALDDDKARIVQLHQVVVEGDAAFWPQSPLRLSGPDEVTGMVVLSRATADLEHNEGAPYATLRSPLPPGEVVDLSLAYLMSHDGALTLRWTSPFPLATARAVLTSELTMVRGAKGPPVRPSHEDGQVPDDVQVFDLGTVPVGGTVELEVNGLITTSRLFRNIGLGLGLAIGLGTLLGMALRPRISVEEGLKKRRDSLLRRLDRLDALGKADEASTRERQWIINGLDQTYRQLDAFTAKPAVDVGAAWDRKA